MAISPFNRRTTLYITLSLDPTYLVSTDKIIHNKTKKELPLVDGKVYLKIGDLNSRWFDVYWLYLLSLYDVKPYKVILDNLHKIRFRQVSPEYNPLNLREVKGNNIMYFTRPIWLNDVFRVVPCWTDFSVDVRGRAVTTENMEFLTPNEENGYLSYSYKGKRPRGHRLTAFAWVFNKNLGEDLIVNHIDGIKSNNHASNLEWCSFVENSRHAVSLGLNPTGTKVRTRDFFTGEIKEFSSLIEMGEYTGLINENTKTLHKKYFTERVPSRLFKGRWEVRTEDDDRPWYYENKDKLEKHGRYTLIVTDKNGTKEEFRSVYDVIKHYKLWNISNNIRVLSAVLKERRPDLKIEVIDDGRLKSIDVYDTLTSESKTLENAGRASDYTGVRRSFITNNCKANDDRITQGRWVFRYTENNVNRPWTVNYEYTQMRIKIKATKNGKTMTFDSLREASRELNISRRAIREKIASGKSHNGWTFKQIAS